MTDVIL